MSTKRKLKCMPDGGVPKGFVSQANSATPLGRDRLAQQWDMNPGRKGTPFVTAYETVKDAKGNPYHNYYFYPGTSLPQEQPQAQPQQVFTQPKQAQLDPMKQPGFNGVLPGIVQQFKFGGDSLLQKGFSNRGTQAPQGLSMDQLITDKNKKFLDYIASNVQRSLVKDSYKAFKGMPKAKDGLQIDMNSVPPEKRPGYAAPAPSGSPQLPQLPSMGASPDTNFPTANWGMYDLFTSADNNAEGVPANGITTTTVGTPDFVRSYKKNGNEFPLVSANNSFQEKRGTSDGGAHVAPPKLRTDWGRIADSGMAHMQLLNAAYNRVEERKQNKFNQSQMTVENITPKTYGNKGDYDTNSGVFRPNQKTALQYKKGGSYKGVNAEEIARLLKEGYEFDIVD